MMKFGKRVAAGVLLAALSVATLGVSASAAAAGTRVTGDPGVGTDGTRVTGEPGAGTDGTRVTGEPGTGTDGTRVTSAGSRDWS
ncbi:MAG: hypothetical protein HOV86_03160 [Thermoactinospora sp.]|nr:hypothetical protein [Thermoactinospora sp.]